MPEKSRIMGCLTGDPLNSRSKMVSSGEVAFGFAVPAVCWSLPALRSFLLLCRESAVPANTLAQTELDGVWRAV